jgi:TRAP-type C4-dicarboxylate transport system substrate-binding protein
MLRRIVQFVPVALACLALAGCSAPVPTATSAAPIQLTFASYSGISDDQQAFIDDLEKLTDDTVTIRVIENWTPHDDGVESISDEVTLTKAVAHGDVDLMFTSNRAFPALGIDGFRSLEAPMLITSREAEKAIVAGTIGKRIQAAVGPAGLTGLAVLPGLLRYPLTSGAPLVGPTDWAGKRIVYVHEPAEESVQARTIAALGGVPAYEGLHVIDDITADMVQGGTDSINDLAGGGATPQGPFMTSNVVLWPNLRVVIANTAMLSRLSAAQRAAVETAGRDAFDAAMAADPAVGLGKEACATAARFGTATPDQLAALRAAVKPVYDWLRTDPVEAATLTDLEGIAGDHPDVDVIDVPEGCAWTP